MKLKAISSLMLATVLGLSSAAWAATSELVDGDIRKVDKASGKLTIKHGPIKSLDMPSMTMVYQVRDATLIDKVQAGDKVRFRAEHEGGKYQVNEIETTR